MSIRFECCKVCGSAEDVSAETVFCPGCGAPYQDALIEGLIAYTKLVLMFYTVGEWSGERRTEWKNLQIPIIRLRPVMEPRYFEATTKGIGDMGRLLLAAAAKLGKGGDQAAV